jgi:multisubunit Na+/H+ antiporter MnhG subunit
MRIKEVVDRRRDLALLFLLFAVGGAWFSLHPRDALAGVPLWRGLALPAVFLVLGIGIWRASEWARWAAGILSIVEAGGCLLSIVFYVSRHGDLGSGPLLAALVMAFFFVLFFGSIAVYLLRPTTGRLFAQIREARARAMAS